MLYSVFKVAFLTSTVDCGQAYGTIAVAQRYVYVLIHTSAFLRTFTKGRINCLHGGIARHLASIRGERRREWLGSASFQRAAQGLLHRA